jgi:predicted component of type VI protein secretion system
MPAQLIALNGGPSILLDKPILLIGRHPECDIQIDSRKISRRHCCIAQVSDYLVVRDLGSTNGVRINGQRVGEGRLGHGDELTLGNHRYRVSWDSRVVRGRAAGRQTERPGELSPEDEMLESCDEPVALEEPGPRLEESGEPPAAAELDDGVPPSEEMQGQLAGEEGSTPAEGSEILPEDLRLRPPSEGAASPHRDPPPAEPPPPVDPKPAE